MEEETHILDTELAGLEPDAWRAEMERIGGEAGSFTALGERHSAVFVEEERRVLLVTFERADAVRASESGAPLGFDMVRASGWSHLCILAEGFTWFRDPAVFAHFDKLTDGGFFDRYDEVIFYGSEMCGYAACAFSVAAPGATVIAVSPQATLDPRVTEWDDRFVSMRRVSFTDRYGFAPDMVEAARAVFLLYDPETDLDAMHVALFAGPNVTKFRCRFMGQRLEAALVARQMLYRMLARAAHGRLDLQSLARIYRDRRDFVPYLRALLTRLDDDDRPRLAAHLCRNVTERMRAPRFRRRLAALREAGHDTGPEPAE